MLSVTHSILAFIASREADISLTREDQRCFLPLLHPPSEINTESCPGCFAYPWPCGDISVLKFKLLLTHLFPGRCRPGVLSVCGQVTTAGGLELKMSELTSSPELQFFL